MRRAEHLTTAEGFLDLGMADEAWAELEEIEPMDRAHSSVIAMRLRILEDMSRFETGVEIARGAVRLHPEDLDIRLLGAAHIRRATGIREALSFLQDSAETFSWHGNYWFAIACLHCQLGEEIKSKGGKSYERVFITYYLPHQTPGSGAWATTHYDPNIDVRVLGFGAEEVPAPEHSDAPSADRIGRWEYSDAIGQVFTVSRVGTGFTMTIEFQDGGKIVEPVTAQREGERVIVRPVDPKDSGDYWILDEQKNLLLMDSEGLIGKAMAISE